MSGWSAEALLRQHAREAGGEPALIEGEVTVTWAELDRRVDQAAGVLRAAGVKPGDRVVLLAGPPIDTVAALLGVLRLGGVAAPIPAGLTRAELEVAKETLGPALVVAAGDLAAGRAAGQEPDPGRPRPNSGSDPVAGLAEPAVIVLTSGTTGRPKGVVLSGAALAASADAWLAALPLATGWLLAMGLGHVAGLGVIWRAIRGRVPVRVVPSADPAAQLAGLRAAPPVSHVSLVPAQLARLLDVAGDGPPPASLRAVPLGGGSIPPSLVTRALGAGWPVVPTYGLSEASSGVTALPTEEARRVSGSAGRPLSGVTVAIEGAGADGIGELVVTSPAGFSGYLGEAPRPAGAPIHTGDLGCVDEAGRLFVVDRRTDLIVRGGENISPAEVEVALHAHPAVADAVVVARPDPLWGQVPVAGIVLREGVADPGDEALAAHCRAAVAGFKVPAAFVRLDALPRTSGGKLRRGAVRALVDGSTAGELARPGGDRIGWRVIGAAHAGTLPIVLLPGTLSTAAQLDRLAAELARPGDVMVHALDRRGSGTSRRVQGGPLDVATHVDDLVAYLDARGVEQAVLVGVSFGGVLALEVAARRPERVLAVVAYEPPYGLLADDTTRAWFGILAERTAAAHRTGGPAAAAETFMRAVAGDAAWDQLGERSRAFLAREGDGAVADSAMVGLDADGLARIIAPTAILTGGASDPFYRPIADALVARVRGARHAMLDGLTHNSPIIEAARVAAAVRAFLAEAGLLSDGPSSAVAPAVKEKPS